MPHSVVIMPEESQLSPSIWPHVIELPGAQVDKSSWLAKREAN